MDADILVAPHAYGGICVFELSIETAASPVLISAADLYQPKNQRIELAFNLKRSALGDFGTLLPDTAPDTTESEPMSGFIQLAMDEFFFIDAVVLNLKGKALGLIDRLYIEASTIWLEDLGTPADPLLNVLINGSHSGPDPQFNKWIANVGDHEKCLTRPESRFDSKSTHSSAIGALVMRFEASEFITSTGCRNSR